MARADLWKTNAFAFSDGSPADSFVSFIRACKSRCQLAPNRPELAILRRPSSTISSAVCANAPTAALATGNLMRFTNLENCDLSTATLNCAAIQILAYFFNGLGIALCRNRIHHQLMCLIDIREFEKS